MAVLACAMAAKHVDIKPLLNDGYQGLKLAEQIRRLRIQAIASHAVSEAPTT